MRKQLNPRKIPLANPIIMDSSDDLEERILSQALTDGKLAYMRKSDRMRENIMASSTPMVNHHTETHNRKRPIRPQSLHRPL